MLARDITVLHVHVCGLETHIAAQVWLKLALFPDWLGNEARLKQSALCSSYFFKKKKTGTMQLGESGNHSYVMYKCGQRSKVKDVVFLL